MRRRIHRELAPSSRHTRLVLQDPNGDVRSVRPRTEVSESPNPWADRAVVGGRLPPHPGVGPAQGVSVLTATRGGLATGSPGPATVVIAGRAACWCS